MSEFFEERHVAGLLVRIDRRLCVAFELCIDIAPEVFRFDAGGVVTFTGSDVAIERDRLLESCRACPVDALLVLDAEGAQVVP